MLAVSGILKLLDEKRAADGMLIGLATVCREAAEGMMRASVQ